MLFHFALHGKHVFLQKHSASEKVVIDLNTIQLNINPYVNVYRIVLFLLSCLFAVLIINSAVYIYMRVDIACVKNMMPWQWYISECLHHHDAFMLPCEDPN